MVTQVVCVEAQLAKEMAVAKQALRMLWGSVISKQGPSAKPGEDAIIVRNLIKTMIGWSPMLYAPSDGTWLEQTRMGRYKLSEDRPHRDMSLEWGRLSGAYCKYYTLPMFGKGQWRGLHLKGGPLAGIRCRRSA